MKKYCQPK